MRERFIETTTDLLADDPRSALVLADISAASFTSAARRHPDRVLNVGIREQLMIGVAGGLALTGLRPIVHSYATFLVDRAYEQIKLDLDHQGVGAVLVSIGGSYDGSAAGRTHMSPGDVALFDTLGDWTVHVPGHPDEVAGLLRAAVGGDEPVYLRLSTQTNDAAYPGDGRIRVLRRGTAGAPLVLAVGPTLTATL
ncbi:transketolase family protein, partial [Micromonospora zhanjiangensis]